MKRKPGSRIGRRTNIWMKANFNLTVLGSFMNGNRATFYFRKKKNNEADLCLPSTYRIELFPWYLVRIYIYPTVWSNAIDVIDLLNYYDKFIMINYHWYHSHYQAIKHNFHYRTITRSYRFLWIYNFLVKYNHPSSIHFTRIVGLRSTVGHVCTGLCWGTRFFANNNPPTRPVSIAKIIAARFSSMIYARHFDRIGRSCLHPITLQWMLPPRSQALSIGIAHLSSSGWND